MTDRVYPSSKPNGTTTAAATANGVGGPINLPPAKSQLYNPNRHPYRPQPTRRRRSRRSCLCLCCFWSTALIIILLLLATIAASVVYVLYQPQRPKFTVSALRIARFNLTSAADDTSHLTSLLNLTVSAKNPNKKLAFLFDPVTITTTTASNQLTIANGSFPKFTFNPKNTTLIRSTLSTSSQISDTESVNSLNSDLKKKTGVPLKIVMDTKVVVKMDSLKLKKVGIRVSCSGIHGLPPKGKSPSVASTSEAKCKVDLRIKIWKWTF
ncbi:NDR1/HIN1-like protein 6 [Cornus florida]|uniref:NDR1/HIN1-like protein 6 n=1 Tax=Cornus florida TaxID=4283 RepID=UPI00289C1E36|nr:NDR1/HIN1-like protein 6 [Cornus florida]